MHSFKDANGREWIIKIDAPKIAEVRSALNVNLIAKDYSAFVELANDEVLLVNVLWVLVRDQADGLTDVQFGRAMVGDPIEHATGALVRAVCDFFPHRQRGMLHSLRERQAAILEAGNKLVLEKINDPALQEEFLNHIRSLISAGLNGATKKPGSSASGPTD